MERAEERWPGLQGDRGLLHAFIAAEVVAALEAGRHSVRLPRWAVKPGTTSNGRRRPDRSLRFTWNEDATRLYVVDRVNGGYRVVTTIKPRVDTLVT